MGEEDRVGSCIYGKGGGDEGGGDEGEGECGGANIT